MLIKNCLLQIVHVSSIQTIEAAFGFFAGAISFDHNNDSSISISRFILWHSCSWAFGRGKKNERGPGEARIAATKILPGAERRCGDFLTQTRRAGPFLPQRFTFADTKAKMNEKRILIWLPTF